MGKYIVIEGGECVGKSTLVTNLGNSVPDSVVSRHPGATPIGKHLRTLVKNPQHFDNDLVLSPFSAQLMLVIDQIEFIDQLLKPSLSKGKTVIADRINFISGVVYGLAEGLSIEDIGKMMAMISTPKPDKLFILTPPWEVVKSRQLARENPVPDRFEDQGLSFIERAHNEYCNLLKTPGVCDLLYNFVDFSNVIYVNEALTEDELLKFVLDNI